MTDTQAPQAIYLKDYQAPFFLIETTELTFKLFENHTLVSSRLSMQPNPAISAEPGAKLILSGGEDLVLEKVSVNGRPLSTDHYQVNNSNLELSVPSGSFVLEIETRIEPQNNTRLEGLYKSNGMFCTQCEAEGFRHITYYLDRPDVMSKFTTRIEADRKSSPILLSNGNKMDSGDLPEGRHWVSWQDPFKKPCYLFALVAGDLSLKEDKFTTCSGREVQIQLFVEAQDLDKCEHAIVSLQNAMRWDEENYGCEYDLDIYMIVAVSHFNMGAMENKGLNIFNTSCVLAKQETTTDAAFQRVEGVVAHEYFHNWSGNRVTCRDWFQLSLKEGFTVFRDEVFSADMGSSTVKRIEEVTFLKTVQFAEDAGPLSHPVRPQSYIEMNNFYTTTVYNKGAEVVRMIHTLTGEAGFRRGTDLYFECFDGQAVTTDDFVDVMEEANDIDLKQFRRWYAQAGTPVVKVAAEYDSHQQTYTLTVKQHCEAKPGTPENEAFLIPLKVALLDAAGQELPLKLADLPETNVGEMVLRVSQFEQQFVFVGLESEPVPSLLRNFSAPVNLEFSYTDSQLSFLMSNDTDGFNRWNAAQQLAQQCIFDQIKNYRAGRPVVLDETLLSGYREVLKNKDLDKAMVANMLTLPSEAYLCGQMMPADIVAVHAVRQSLIRLLAENLKSELLDIYETNKTTGQYKPDAQQVAQRSLKNCSLMYLMTLGDEAVRAACYSQFSCGNNMTDVSSALRALVHTGAAEGSVALAEFIEKWQHEPLVVDQWFAVQAASPQSSTLDNVKKLMEHPLFELTNPNKVRALIATFCSANLINFHSEKGEGYDFLAENVVALDKINPQIAARIVNPLSRWRQQNDTRQALMKAALEKIRSTPSLSNDLYEVVSKSL